MSLVLDAIYDAAIDVEGWRPALRHVAGLFDCHFADLFARSNDWTAYHGIAVGLDRDDYEHGFLDQWSDRNVWAKASPAHLGGEITPTWKMVTKQDVLRSPIYNEYLKKRELNEGLRLMLWAGDEWLQDVSLLRRWSAGPFAGEELRLARSILPHLQRAAALSRRLRGLDGLASFDTLEQPAFVLDVRGRLMRQNAAGEAVLSRRSGLVVRDGTLEAGSAADTACLQTAIARAGCIGRSMPSAATVTVACGPPGAMAVSVLPLREQAAWELPVPRCVLVTVQEGWGRPSAAQRLADVFRLTEAEASLAAGLMAGKALSDIAANRGRSINTLRAQLARIMTKTNTRRQGELISLLSRSG